MHLIHTNVCGITKHRNNQKLGTLHHVVRKKNSLLRQAVIDDDDDDDDDDKCRNHRLR